jgi:hypothetical protein
MFYCISYIKNHDSNLFIYSVIIEYNNNIIDYISCFQKNSFDENLLYEKFILWIENISEYINFTQNNFWFVNYGTNFLSINSSLKSYFGKKDIPSIYNHSYSIDKLFSNVYGFTSKVSIAKMKCFMNLNVKDNLIENIECNYLIFIFIECLKNYGSRINNFFPDIIIY